MTSNPHQARVTISGQSLVLRNLGKVLFPDGTTKARVIDYYVRVAPVLLPLLANRPVTRFRWPDGVQASFFVEKDTPRGTPAWVRRVTLPTPGSSRDLSDLTFPFLDDVAALVWASNLAALELHVPQWRIGSDSKPQHPDRLVIDLDPGPPAGLVECAEVALAVRDRLTVDGFTGVPVTSGSKGMQVYAAVSGTQSSDLLSSYAHRIANELAARHHGVISTMRKADRPGKVLVDWSQNSAAKTTISPYSLRGRAEPWVATPRTWAEIEADSLQQVHYRDIAARIDRFGDLTELLQNPGPSLPTESER
ncbi:MAG: non-homologous end-joining DNA ligase [Actinomycetota bacterium]